MIHIAPFRPLRYEPREISFISRVVAPPYDLISQAEAEELRRRDPHNVVRLILGKEGKSERCPADYEEAALTTARWRAEGILVREPEHAIYLCQQSFTLDEEQFVRRGFLSAILLEDGPSARILPHEHTTRRPVRDRLRLMEACRASLSPIFGIFSDTNRQIDQFLAQQEDEGPLYEFCTPDDICYRVWRITDSGIIGRLASLLRKEQLLIADGHHRYETAVAYRDKHRDAQGKPGSAPEDFLLAFCVSARNPGLRVLPTHRLVRTEGPFDPNWLADSLAARFALEESHIGSPRQLQEVLRSWHPEEAVIGCYLAGNRLLLIRPGDEGFRVPDSVPGPPPLRRLPVTVLHYSILRPFFDIPCKLEEPSQRMRFSADLEQIYWAIESGRSDAAFLLPTISPGTLAKVARSGHRMPPKTTWFYPKIPSGLVLYPFEDDDKLPRLLHR